MAEDIVDLMLKAWEQPFSTEYDPRRLLLDGAKEIKGLRRELGACRSVIQSMHEVHTEMEIQFRKMRPDPNVPLYIMGIALVLGIMFTLWILV